MTERDFQLALIHLCANIDRDRAETALDGRFALSPDEHRALEELATSQREGLLLLNQLSHDKQRRQLRDALPASRLLGGAALEALLDVFQANGVEGGRELAATMRSFARLAGDIVDGEADPARALQLIRFEAAAAALSMGSSSDTVGRPRSSRSIRDLRLAPEAGAVLMRCTYDVAAVLVEPTSLDLDHLPARRCRFFLFNAAHVGLRVMAVSARLAYLLAELGRGSSVGDALAALDDDRAANAGWASIERLIEAGAPFLPAAAPERAGKPAGCDADG